MIPAEHLPPKLSKKSVPKAFLHLIPLAEKYGITDDGYRLELVHSLSSEEKEELVLFLEEYDNKLDGWLAGLEADGPEFSDEYITFSALRMAADELS